MIDQKTTAVKAAVPAAILGGVQATRLPLQCKRLRAVGGFTLVELLVTVGVLVLLVLLFTQLLNSAASITTLGHKQIDADSQARQLLDRMGVDLAQLVKRSDVDIFAKGTTAPNSVGGAMTGGNDQIAFYSAVPGYYPSAGSQSPVSLAAYRVNSQNKLERMGVGLVWNGVSTTDTPVVFLPLTIAATWPTAVNLAALPTPEPRAEVIGPQVFRFEYYYLLKSANGYTLIDPTTHNPTTVLSSGVGTYTVLVNGTPTSVSLWAPGTNSFVKDVAAIIVDIAVVDSKSKVLLTDAQITTLGASLSDYTEGMVPGQLRNNWQNTLNTNATLPRPALSGVRVYERFFYLSPPTL